MNYSTRFLVLVGILMHFQSCGLCMQMAWALAALTLGCRPPPGEPRPQHVSGGVWPEPVHHRAGPAGGVSTLRPPGGGQRGVRPAHRALPRLRLCLLREAGGFQRGMAGEMAAASFVAQIARDLQFWCQGLACFLPLFSTSDRVKNIPQIRWGSGVAVTSESN